MSNGIAMSASSTISVGDQQVPSCGCLQGVRYGFIHRQQVNFFVFRKKLKHTACVLVVRSRQSLEQGIASIKREDILIDTREFCYKDFPDPSFWWDNRLNKRNSRHLDMVLSNTKEVLRVDGWLAPLWVQAELPAITHRTVGLDCDSYSKECCNNYGMTSKCLKATGSGALLCSSVPFGHVDYLCTVGQLDEALEAVGYMSQQGISISSNTFLCLLVRCINEKDLAAGREVHRLIMRSGHRSDLYLGNLLICMFLSFESLLEANQVFSGLFCPDVFSWSAIISAHVELGQNEQAVKLYHQMLNSNVTPDGQIFVAVLKACSCIVTLKQGKQVHYHIIESGLECDSFVGSTLIDMYVKCGSLEDAHFVFDKLPERTAVTWNALIAGYTKHGNGHQALRLFEQMEQQEMKPNRVTFVCILKACSTIAVLEHGRQIHALVVESGFEFGSFIGNTLIDMYAKCRSLKDARSVFDRLLRRDVVTCNVLIAGYAKHGHMQEVLDLFKQMHKEGIGPDPVTFICILKACSGMASLDQGRLIHVSAIESGFELNASVGNSLVHMYTQCGSLIHAHMLFDRLPKHDVVTWSALITGYAQKGHGQEAVQLFEQMQLEGIEPNKVTFGCILKACSSKAALEQGTLIHIKVIESGSESDDFVGSALVDMYAKCESLEDASVVFDRLPKKEVVTWSVLIQGYAEQGLGQEALLLFERMKKEGIEPNPVTFVSILKACANTAALEQGRHIHVHIIECGLESDVYVGSTLIDMYAESGHLENAQNVFDRLPQRNVVTWNTLIAGYAQHRECLEALQLFQQMQLEGLVEPNTVTFFSVLKACSRMAAIELGRWVHAHIIESRFSSDICVGSSIIDMYVKCGCLEDARTVFEGLANRNVVTWNTLMAGYTQHKNGQEALLLYQRMQLDAMEPDLVTLLCAVKACASIAALQQGRCIHSHIIEHGFDLDISVGNALIDMYSNCGSLNDAHVVFDRLPKQDIVSWSALIAGYAQRNDYSGALKCFEGMQHAGWKPDDVAFICLLTACSHAGLVDEGCLHFKSLREGYKMKPILEHYNPVVYLLGHAGLLDEAEDLLETAPFQHNIGGWTSLLHSCRFYSNLDIGRRCFDRAISMDHGNAAGYVLMSNIYTYAGKWREAEKVEEMRRHANAWKKPAKAFIEIGNQVHEFIVGDIMHPQSDEIYTRLKTLSIQIRKEGYKPHLDLVLDISSDGHKENALCGHSEKLAIAFGLISTAQGTTIRVAKNLRMCADCHVATQLISKVEMRNIIVKDAYCIHQFQNGLCSCKECYLQST